jgi:hypothetical protein
LNNVLRSQNIDRGDAILSIGCPPDPAATAMKHTMLRLQMSRPWPDGGVTASPAQEEGLDGEGKTHGAADGKEQRANLAGRISDWMVAAAVV